MPIELKGQTSALENLLGSLSTGLSSGFQTGLQSTVLPALQNLTQMQIQDIVQRRQAARVGPALSALAQLRPDIFGKMTQDQFGQLAMLPEKTLDVILKQTLQKPLIQMGGEEPLARELESIVSGTPQLGALEALQQQLPIGQPEQLGKPAIETKPAIRESIKPEVKPLKLPPGAQIQQEKANLEAVLQTRPDLSATAKAQLRKRIEDREDRLLGQQEKIDKATSDYFEDISNKAQGSEQVNLRLDKMLDLVNKGNLVGIIPGTILDTLKRGIPYFDIGLDLFGVTSTDTQEFKKLQADMLENIRDWFGGRITNDEIKRFMDRLPSLNQSAEGKRRVINDLRLLNEGAILRKKIMDQIIEEHGGYRVHNLRQLVEERAKPELTKIAKRFKENQTSMQELAKEAKRRRQPLQTLLQETLVEPFIGEFVQQFEPSVKPEEK